MHLSCVFSLSKDDIHVSILTCIPMHMLNTPERLCAIALQVLLWRQKSHYNSSVCGVCMSYLVLCMYLLSITKKNHWQGIYLELSR